jgi:protein ImuA
VDRFRGASKDCINNQYSAMAADRSPADPRLVLPHVWRGRELGDARERTLPTGHAALDAELPGGGWPQGALVEILQQHPQQHVWQLLHPALERMQRAEPGPTVLVAPPFEPFGPGLKALGLLPSRLLWIDADKPATRLWAAEQALKCADVSAVLAWLPQARSEDLRRLHLCAQQAAKLLFVFRRAEVRDASSPARLRLLVQGTDAMEVLIVKRRGPPLLQPLVLPARTSALRAVLAARRRQSVPVPAPSPATTTASDVLDRTATFAG